MTTNSSESAQASAEDIKDSDDAVAAVTEASPEHESKKPVPTKASGGKVGGAWVGLVIGAIVTVVLLVFIMQNPNNVEVTLFTEKFSLPLGILVLFAAIAGAIVMALFAGLRIIQLRMRNRKARRMLNNSA